MANYNLCYSQSQNNQQDISAWLAVCYSSHLYNNEYILYLRLLRNIYCIHINFFPTIINIVLKHLHICGLSYSLYYDDILLHFTVHVELDISILFARFLLIGILICQKLSYNAADFIVLHHDHFFKWEVENNDLASSLFT